MLAQKELGRLSPVGRMLPAMLDEARRMSVHLWMISAAGPANEFAPWGDSVHIESVITFEGGFRRRKLTRSTDLRAALTLENRAPLLSRLSHTDSSAVNLRLCRSGRGSFV